MSRRMLRREPIPRTEISKLVLANLAPLLPTPCAETHARIDESLGLIGGGSALTSLELVTLLVDIEQSLEDQYHISITLAAANAMSRANSPFRTVQSLVDYICDELRTEER